MSISDVENVIRDIRAVVSASRTLIGVDPRC